MQRVPVCNIIFRAGTRTLLDSDWEETLSAGSRGEASGMCMTEAKRPQCWRRETDSEASTPAAHIHLSPLRSAGVRGGAGSGGGASEGSGSPLLWHFA